MVDSHPRTQRLCSPWPAVGKQQPLKDPIGSPKISDFQLNCACVASKPNMASSSPLYALKAVGKKNIILKEKHLAIFKLVFHDIQDVRAVLPTGFGKCLIYQTFAPFADFLTIRNQLNLVIQSSHCISPLNVLIKETGLRKCILKADRLASDCQDIEEDSDSS